MYGDIESRRPGGPEKHGPSIQTIRHGSTARLPTHSASTVLSQRRLPTRYRVGGHSMAYLERDRQALLFGGYSAGNNLWAFGSEKAT